MKFTKDWLSDHLKTNKSEHEIISKLNGIGLEVEKVEPIESELSDFIVAKIIKWNEVRSFKDKRRDFSWNALF